MSGFLTLHANPTANFHAATKQYVDTKLALAGGTMSGFINLHADPSTAMQAATKQYVDTKAVAGHNHARGRSPTGCPHSYLSSAEGWNTLGVCTLHADPSSAMHAATKQYVDGEAAGVGAGMWSIRSEPAVKTDGLLWMIPPERSALERSGRTLFLVVTREPFRVPSKRGLIVILEAARWPSSLGTVTDFTTLQLHNDSLFQREWADDTSYSSTLSLLITPGNPRDAIVGQHHYQSHLASSERSYFGSGCGVAG